MMGKKTLNKKCQVKNKGLKNVAKHLYCLHVLGGGKNKLNKIQTENVIKHMDKSQLCAVRCVMKKFVNNEIPMSKKDIQKLKKDRKYIYKLQDSKSKDSEMKAALMRGGGVVLPMVLSALAPTLTKMVVGTVGKIFKKKPKRR
jgi:hypothetical protein